MVILSIGHKAYIYFNNNKYLKFYFQALLLGFNLN